MRLGCCLKSEAGHAFLKLNELGEQGHDALMGFEFEPDGNPVHILVRAFHKQVHRIKIHGFSDREVMDGALGEFAEIPERRRAKGTVADRGDN